MSQHDSPLNQHMLGTMGGGNGGLDAAYGQMHAMMAEENRRQREFFKAYGSTSEGVRQSFAPARSQDPEATRRFWLASGWLAVFAAIMLYASEHFGFRFMWGFCAMLATETMIWLGGQPAVVWPWGKWIGLLLLFGAGGLVTFLAIKVMKLALQAVSSAATKLGALIILGLRAIGRLAARGMMKLVRGLWRQIRSRHQAS